MKPYIPPGPDVGPHPDLAPGPDAGTDPGPAMPPSPPPQQAMQQAAQWFALLQSGQASAAERARWQAWLDGAPEHRAAWGFVERVSQRFQPLRHEAASRLAADALQTASARLARRRTLLGVAAVAGTGGLLGWAVWRQQPGALDAVLAWAADHRSATGQRRDIRLADGSQIWLASATALDEDVRADLRRLRLRSGEILVQTAADAAGRPFVVDTAHGRMRALGTRFNVRLEDGEGDEGSEGGSRTQLAVYEGAVQITLAESGQQATLHAGQQVRFSARRLHAPAAADPARQAWAQGVLLAQGIPLGQVIAELARYRRGHIAIAPAAAGLQVLGSYPLDDVDTALAMLQRALPIRITQPLPWWTRVERR
ncbi:FecR domain-containing protein [Vandammella animalimorsus]|nr:FecR domain-containing protein [Vandammella animalimorsus]